jgi:hypothetical protein
MTSGGYHVQTDEHRWPVVATAEPEGARTIRGYVAIIEQTEEGAPFCSRRVMFLDTEGRPLQSLALGDLDVFFDAAQAACVELGMRVCGPASPAGDIIR